jgi:hypothetical protein
VRPTKDATTSIKVGELRLKKMEKRLVNIQRLRRERQVDNVAEVETLERA